MNNTVVQLPRCLSCKWPMRLVTVVGDKDCEQVTRILECVRCHTIMVRRPTERNAGSARAISNLSVPWAD